MANQSGKFLTPSYLETDFATMKAKLQNLMSQSDTFKDYNYEGNNITMLMELVSYIGDLNQFYTNLVAKNVYEDTADVYETVHRLVQQKGYIPKGNVSSEVTLTMTVSGASIGDQLYIPSFTSFDTGLTTDEGDSIYYTLTSSVTHTTETSGTCSFDVVAREGEVFDISYKGDDLVDGQIVLPFYDFDFGVSPFDVPSMQVLVEGEEWTRIEDFYEELSGLTDNDLVYQFNYNKYEQNVLVFNSSREMPGTNDDISIKLLRTNIDEGAVGPGVLTTVNEDFTIQNITQSSTITSDYIEFNNSLSSLGHSDRETIDEMKNNAKGNIHSQLRNITRKDYTYHLEARSDVVGATAWGEREVNPGNTNEYNKVYLSVVPPLGDATFFQYGTIETSGYRWTDSQNPAVSGMVQLPTQYNSEFMEDVYQYLEPRRQLCIYEVFVLPDIIWFRFDIGIKVKRIYDFVKVQEAVTAKLKYYFDSTFRSYEEIIDFKDIHNHILDPTVEDDSWEANQILGIDNIVFRDIATFTSTKWNDSPEEIFEPNTELNFPQFVDTSYQSYVDNVFRPIQLGYNQFAMVALDMCVFFNEG